VRAQFIRISEVAPTEKGVLSSSICRNAGVICLGRRCCIEYAIDTGVKDILIARAISVSISLVVILILLPRCNGI
jgi:hypothetical protein